jgi:hypothetical protein
MDCKCEIDKLSNRSGIKKHFYDHVIHYFIPKVLCKIIEHYVGDSPEYQGWRNGDFYTYYKTFGTPCIDEGYKIESELKTAMTWRQCTIVRCDLMSYISGLCYGHYMQWLKYPVTHYHEHKCNECLNKNIKQLLMTLNRYLKYNITNHILSFIDVHTLLTACLGHTKPRNVPCDICNFGK